LLAGGLSGTTEGVGVRIAVDLTDDGGMITGVRTRVGYAEVVGQATVGARDVADTQTLRGTLAGSWPGGEPRRMLADVADCGGALRGDRAPD
jgi:hypothetical protein